jgi:hypothetical protein
MSKQPPFWDSSALVPLYLHESTRRPAHCSTAEGRAGGVVGSPVEVHSAVERLHRLDAHQRLSRAAIAAGFSVLELS